MRVWRVRSLLAATASATGWVAVAATRSASGGPVSRLVSGLRTGCRAALAEAITLVESSSGERQRWAAQLMTQVTRELRHTLHHYQRQPTPGRSSAEPPASSPHPVSLRVGFSGPPGAGKSTLIERLGGQLIEAGHRLAVLAVDPSSSTTGGSLLADKTRMPSLTAHPSAYIRPSPNCGHLGGVTRATSDAILLCEYAGYDMVFVETVGVGQSELLVADMVDIFLLILSPSGGDEFQGLKRGIVEMADLVVVNKADGDLLPASVKIQAEYLAALKLMPPRRTGCDRQVLRVSAATGFGCDQLQQHVQLLGQQLLASGQLASGRERQAERQLRQHVIDCAVAEVTRRLAQEDGDDGHWQRHLAAVGAAEMSVREAAQSLADALFRDSRR